MNKDLADFTESIGNFIKYWGFKKVQGQVWALLYLSDHPLNSRKIQSALGISKALLSNTINELIEYKLIKQVGNVEHGRALYIANENIIEVIKDVLADRELKLIEDALIKIERMENIKSIQEFDINHKRLKNIKKLTIFAQKTVKAIIYFQDFSFKKLSLFNKI